MIDLDLSEIFDALSDFFTPDQTSLWLSLRNPRLGDRTPMAVLATGGRDEVMQVINRLRG
jgi:hypothetical protein